jgi:hypothetical protein
MPYLIRMMIDLDSWLQCGDVSVPYALRRVRHLFWQAMLNEEEMTDINQINGGENLFPS